MDPQIPFMIHRSIHAGIPHSLHRTTAPWCGRISPAPLCLASLSGWASCNQPTQQATAISVAACSISTFAFVVVHFRVPKFSKISFRNIHYWGTQQHIWFKHCATSRNVAGSIPDGVIGIFYKHIPLTEMSIRNISWGVKATCAQGRQPYHLHVMIVLKSGSLHFLETSGIVQAVQGFSRHYSNAIEHKSTVHYSCNQSRPLEISYAW